MAGGPEAETLAFNPAVIDGAQVVFDVVAVPPETPLIRYAKTGGKAVITGAEVITLQAVEQFVLYTGVRPPRNRSAAPSSMPAVDVQASRGQGQRDRQS